MKTAAQLHAHVPPDWYESSVKTNILQRFWHRRRFKAVERFSEKVKGYVLDIGSADGYFTREILEQTGAGRVEGIDVLKSSVDYASKRYSKNKRLRFSLGDAHKLEFPPNSFSAVYCLEALEHVYQPRTVLSEILRVLKPGGYTIILVPAENFLFKRIVWPLWIRWRGRIWQDTHLSFFDNNKLPELMSGVGFTQVSTHRFILGMLLFVKARKSG